MTNVLLCWVSSFLIRMISWSAIARLERFGSNGGGISVSGGFPKCLIMSPLILKTSMMNHDGVLVPPTDVTERDAACRTTQAN